MLSLHTLGGAALSREDRPVTGLGSRTAVALFIYLAHHRRAFPRETLADFFWDDRPGDQAAANLRSILSTLRRRLGDYLLLTRQTAAFNHDCTVHLDSATFTELLAPLDQWRRAATPLDPAAVAALEDALLLYQGDFLAGFHLPESRAFDEWATLQRERLRRRAFLAAELLARHHLAQGHYAAGLDVAARLGELDPYSETAHRLQLLLLARTGRYHAALNHYAKYAALLADELHTTPAAETIALAERIRAAHRGPRHNLTPDPTPFVGREKELADIAAHLARPECRLLTLVGPGGVGKTRLARQAARAYADDGPQAGRFLNGVFFIALAATSTADQLPGAISQALGQPLTGRDTPAAELFDHLRPKALLLVLDNLEQLPGAAPFLADLLAAAPDVNLLATSRERLYLQEEWVLDVGGLPLVDGPDSPATRLFQQTAARTQGRARPVAPTSAADQAAILEICRLLDGLPLGIELAAGWVRHHTPAEIARTIAHDLDFLASPLHNVPARHRSLRAVFDHTWALLTAEAQAAAARLSIFHTPFAAEAAQQVAAVRPVVLRRLADKSLLQRDAAGRYAFHALLHHFCAEQRAARPDAAATGQAHQEYFLSWMAEQATALRTGRAAETMAAVAAVEADVRAAWHHALERADFAAAGRALESVYIYHWQRNLFAAGEAWLQAAVQAVEAALARPGPAPDPALSTLLGRLYVRQAELQTWQGRYATAEPLLDTGRELCAAGGAVADVALADATRGNIRYWTGDFAAAQPAFQQALAGYQAVGDDLGAATMLNALANTLCDLEADYATAIQLYAESLALARRRGDRNGEARALVNAGVAQQALGDLTAARSLYEKSLVIYRELGVQHGEAAVLNYLATLAAQTGDPQAALAMLEQALAINRATGNRQSLVHTLRHLGNVQRDRGAFRPAGQHYRAALQTAQTIAAQSLLLGVLAETAHWHTLQDRPERAAALYHYILSRPETGAELRALVAERRAALPDTGMADQPEADPLPGVLQELPG